MTGVYPSAVDTLQHNTADVPNRTGLNVEHMII